MRAMADLRSRAVELRASEKEEGVVRGYVTTFDDPYPIGHKRSEVIKRGAFDVKRAIPLMFEHDHAAGPIGVSRSLTEDDRGLLAEFELFRDTERGRAVWLAMRAGALQEFSIGFYADQIETRSADGKDTEEIEKGTLVEVSSVLKGANPNTETVSVRAVPVVAPAVDPGAVAGVPGAGTVEDGTEEEKPTKAGMLSKVGELVELAIELNMEGELAKIVTQYVKLLASTPGQEQTAPPAQPGAVAPAPAVVPAGRGLSDGLRLALSELGL